MLQFDIRVTIKEYDEKTTQRLHEFDYDEDFAFQVKENLERLLGQTPILITKDKVFVSSVTNVSPVP